MDPDPHAAQPLGDVAVGAGAGDDPVLAGEALGLLVEGGERDPRVEDLEHVDLLDDVEQVLVVGHRVEAVEGMGHVDEAALAADLGDRLLHRHPARDLLLEEEADHLALLGGLHLLGDDHLDVAHLLGDPARLERPGDLVVVGDRDRAEAAVAGRLEQHLDRRRAVGRVVGVHVQVDLDQRPPGDPPPRLRVAGAVVAARGEPPVDRLELGRDLGPVALRPRPPRRARRGRGSSAPAARRSPAVATVRASRRPKKISTSGRATWVERTRSCGAWKVATLSEMEWRSAAEETRGANGSWTWTMSSGVDASRFLTGSPEPSDERPRGRAARAPRRPG